MKRLNLKLGLAAAAMVCTGSIASAQIDHLVISEFAVTPTEGEFIEIHNPTLSAIALDDYYVTDATFSGGTFYYNIVAAAEDGPGGGSFSDFSGRFPAGSSIAAGEFQVIAINGADNFATEFPAVTPDYEIVENATADTPGVPNMLTADPGASDLLSTGGLTNGGEVIILFTWDGTSDLVTDVDYVNYEGGSTGAAGGNAEAVDKTGVVIDGDDGDSATSAYLPDTAIASQIPAASHNNGESMERQDLSQEPGETLTGGNGITGNDETSEDLFTAFSVATPPTPGAGPATSVNDWNLY